MNEQAASAPEIPLGGWAVLGLLREQDAHGWALVRALAADGEIGAVWTIRRALVYRTVEQLIASSLIEPIGTEPGNRGTPRTLLRITETGRHRFDEWLDQPVPH